MGNIKKCSNIFGTPETPPCPPPLRHFAQIENYFNGIQQYFATLFFGITQFVTQFTCVSRHFGAKSRKQQQTCLGKKQFIYFGLKFVEIWPKLSEVT